jgi:hypothetical protein
VRRRNPPAPPATRIGRYGRFCVLPPDELERTRAAAATLVAGGVRSLSRISSLSRARCSSRLNVDQLSFDQFGIGGIYTRRRSRGPRHGDPPKGRGAATGCAGDSGRHIVPAEREVIHMRHHRELFQGGFTC